MTFKTKHPALPDQSGWYLVRRGQKWRTGYHGKEHRHINTTVDTEADAIAWLNDKVAEYTKPHSGDVAQRFLCGNWREA